MIFFESSLKEGSFTQIVKPISGHHVPAATYTLEDPVKSPLLTPPNLITSCRFFIAFAAFFFIVGLDFGIVLILYSIAIGTDLIDGHVARRFNCIGKHGAYFDALADFVLIVAVYSALACIQRISWLLVMVPVVMFGQFILSTLVGFKVYDPVGKYAGSFHMIVQLLLLLPVCGSYNIVLTAIVFLFSGACIFSRYRNSISMVFARSTRELST